MATSIGHRLAATGLVIRVFNVETEAFQELESGNANLGVKGVDVAGNEQPDAHGRLRSSWRISSLALGGKGRPGAPSQFGRRYGRLTINQGAWQQRDGSSAACRHPRCELGLPIVTPSAAQISPPSRLTVWRITEQARSSILPVRRCLR